MTAQQKQGNLVGIITMIFLFGMISFVTNLAAPIGVIWKNNPAFEDSSFLGMLGNMMNFLAYLFMGIPAGKMLVKFGYKKTAMAAVAIGLLGVFIQYLSGIVGVNATLFSLPANFFVYLLGAFVAGFCVCMLNTVVNPMLNLLGGGGNKGNQLIQTAGTFNSLMATVTPMMVGAMIGAITSERIASGEITIASVNPVLYIAMGVFAATFLILLFIKFKEPVTATADTKFESSPWKFQHFVLGAIAIFVYVGVEVGIPGTLNFYLSDVSGAGAGLPAATAAATGGFVAGTYWFLMLIGRFLGSLFGGKVSSKSMMVFATCLAAIFVICAILIPKTSLTSMPVFTGSAFAMAQVPVSALLLVLCGLCTSIMWGSIFNLATAGLGKYTPLASGIFMMMVVGGGVIPLLQGWLADLVGYMSSYWLILAGVLYMMFYALVGSKNVNKDIKID